MVLTSFGLRAGLAGLGLRCTSQRSCLASSRSFSTRINTSLVRPKVVAPLYVSRRTYTSKVPADELAPVTSTLPEYDNTSLIEATSDPLNTSLSLTDTVTQAIPPLAYGDFAQLGLTSWSPIGIIAWSFEVLNVATGLPWFWTIVAGSAMWRLTCVPFALHGIRAGARLRPFQPQVLNLQNRITAARATQDTIALQRATIEMKQLYENAKVNPLTGMLLPTFIQLPVNIGMFFALQRMASTPVVQLTDGGVSSWFWANNLTVMDPTYALPALFCGMMNAQIIIGARDTDMSASPSTGHVMNLMRGISIFAAFFMASFPAGVLVGLITNTVMIVTQSLLLRSAAVRRLLNIPVVPKGTHSKLPSMLESIKYAKEKFANPV